MSCDGRSSFGDGSVWPAAVRVPIPVSRQPMNKANIDVCADAVVQEFHSICEYLTRLIWRRWRGTCLVTCRLAVAVRGLCVSDSRLAATKAIASPEPGS